MFARESSSSGYNSRVYFSVSKSWSIQVGGGLVRSVVFIVEILEDSKPLDKLPQTTARASIVSVPAANLNLAYFSLGS